MQLPLEKINKRLEAHGINIVSKISPYGQTKKIAIELELNLIVIMTQKIV